MCDAIDTILSMQNPDGSYASYELIRGSEWLEYLNTAEVFGKSSEMIFGKCTFAERSVLHAGRIMIEYSYPECTTSSITALALFRKVYPDYRTADIEYVWISSTSHIFPKILIIFQGAQ